ncbi:ParB/RepB/Spo0J family partition protein (plasmid) [Streptomyces sp. AHU1]|uniref:ParB/RepB/Spo0J family partition protein n=1 Tax=Streptomyces sp. AHU1 TaxID=3377215 RepID=UPI003877F04F
MSKADQLGNGRFGGGVRTVSARRQAVAAATGVPTEGVAPPGELPVHRISPNPDNPRSRLGDLTDLSGSLATHGQKVAITVMNRDAYVKANPEREGDLEPDTTHVVIDGSSRLAAAREAGLTTIKVMVSDEQGGTSEELLESALVANIHRQDLDELDEARALQRLLQIHGSQRELAKRLHRSQGWVSQRLALLNLTPELQHRIGEEPIDLLRAVGNKPADQQKEALEELKAERTRKENANRAPQPRPAMPTPAEPAPTGTMKASSAQPQEPPQPVEAVPDKPAEAPDDHGAITDTASVAPAPGLESGPDSEPEVEQAVPKPRGVGEPSLKGDSVSEDQPPRQLPYDDPMFIAMHLVRKMELPAFFEMLRALNQLGQERDPEKYAEILTTLATETAR